MCIWPSATKNTRSDHEWEPGGGMVLISAFLRSTSAGHEVRLCQREALMCRRACLLRHDERVTRRESCAQTLHPCYIARTGWPRLWQRHKSRRFSSREIVLSRRLECTCSYCKISFYGRFIVVQFIMEMYHIYCKHVYVLPLIVNIIRIRVGEATFYFSFTIYI